MGLDTGIEGLLKDIIHFLEFALKDQTLPSGILEEKFRITGRIATILQKKNVGNVSPPSKWSTPQQNSTYVSMEPPGSTGFEYDSILRSGHRHRNGIVIEMPTSDFFRTESEEKQSDSGCQDSSSQFSDDALDSKRISLSSTSSSESTGTRKEDDTASVRSAVSSLRSPSILDVSLPYYEEAESRSVYTGAIKRKAGLVPGWKTYAGAICDSKLLLYCSTKVGAPKLAIPLDSYEVRATSVSKTKKNFEFVIVGAGKQTYKFRTETEDDLSSWVRSLESLLRSLAGPICIGGATEDESTDSLIDDFSPAETVTRPSTFSVAELRLSMDEPKFDILSDMKRLEEYENLKKMKIFEQSMTELEEIKEETPAFKVTEFETRDLPSLPNSDNLYDDIGARDNEYDENIYDMPSKQRRKEEFYDVPMNLDASRRSSTDTLYDAPEELIYDAPNISFDPSELYDVPRFAYTDSPQSEFSAPSLVPSVNLSTFNPSDSLAPPLGVKIKLPKRSDSVREAYYNVPKHFFGSEVYDEPKPRTPVSHDGEKNCKNKKEGTENSKNLENKSPSDLKSKIPRKLSFTGTAMFKDELELKLNKKKRDVIEARQTSLDKDKKEFMDRLLSESAEDGRFFASLAVVEPVKSSEHKKLFNSVSSRNGKQTTSLADVFANAKSVFSQKSEKCPTKLRLDFDNIPAKHRIDPDEIKQRSVPSTPTKVAPPRPPAPLVRVDEAKENLAFTKKATTPIPPLIPPKEEIYEDIEQPYYAEPEIYSARWAYNASSENELSLRKGETVYVLNKVNTESWFCKSKKTQGFVPPLYLARVS